MNQYDYIIVGSGPGGSVMANRLSEDGTKSVLVIEAGRSDDSWLIHMPKGIGKLLTGSPYVNYYKTKQDNVGREHMWVRGKTVGGSSSVNGMVYSRGQPEDYDNWESLGASGWNWNTIKNAFRKIENHVLGEDELRGIGGGMHITMHKPDSKLSEVILETSEACGTPAKDDVNREDQVGLGHAPEMIRGGRRWSVAKAFLRPALSRRNVALVTSTSVRRVLFEGKRAFGVECDGPSGRIVYLARAEVVLCAGAFESPKILMLSGIGPAAHLAEKGVELLHDSPNVGQNLQEHYGLSLAFRLKNGASLNKQFSGWRLYRNVLQYILSHRGLMASGVHELMGFAKTDSQSTAADTQLFITPMSRVPDKALVFEKKSGISCLIYPGRPTTTGTVRLSSADPSLAPEIEYNALTTPYDQRIAISMVHYVRRLFATKPLSDFIDHETVPGPSIKTDDQILDCVRRTGSWGYHTCGTVRMGDQDDAPLDTMMRVRGVKGLRVVDASSFPAIVSANTTAPVAAMAWFLCDRMKAEIPVKEHAKPQAEHSVTAASLK
ncbi:GMC family oxidoreductase [Pseudomonas sp. NFX224]|uniref:GMC family oxidoreductase n=1 Tax=Pseudomonas sp. NFX224 TaxID=3402862 RepID=UPI003AFA07E6